jgi:outer membrane protein assembly factor BamB/predicted phosphodiesterase
MKNLLKIILLVTIVIVNSIVCNAQKYTGYVYVDNNRNGIYDSGDKKLEGVAVSDGLNVVLTDAEGKFSLPGHAKERFIFITLPSGYTISKHYIPVSATEFTFGLKPFPGRVGDDGSHKFIHISDTEISETQSHEVWANKIRDYARNEQVAFIVHTGDICYEAGMTSHIKLINTTNMGFQVHYTIGNHDMERGNSGEEMFERIFGPVFYSFNVGNVHYIVTPMLYGTHRPSYTWRDVYEWMKNDLALVPPGRAVMVFNHDLLTGGDQFNYGDRETFINLNEHNLKAWIFGHWHLHHIRKQGAVYAVSTSPPNMGGIDHSVSAFRVMHVDGTGDFVSELRYTYVDKKLNIVYPPNGTEVPLLENNKIPLSVNTYNTVSPVSKITYTLYVDEKEKMSGELIQNTDWNFSCEIPIDMEYQDKQMLVTVKAVFRNGEVAKSTNVFRSSNQPAQVNMSNSWTNLLGNSSHTGGIIADSLKVPLMPAWVSNVSSNLFMASPIIVDGNVYVATVDENLQEKAAIVVLNGKTGQEIWRYKTRNSVKNTIVAAKGNIFAQDADGYLYAVNAETGILSWEKKLNVASLPALVEGLATENGIVFAGTGRGLCAVDAVTGKTLWENTGWSQREGATTTITYANNRIFSGAQWGGVYANDATTGEMLWSNTNRNDGLHYRGASVAAINGMLYLISRSSFFILDAETGQVIVRRELNMNVDVTSTPLVTAERIIFGSNSGLISLTANTHEIEWIFQTGEAVIYTSPYTSKNSRTIETSPIISGNTVFFGASDGNFYAVNATNGALLWKHATGAPIFSTPAVSGNTVIFTDYGGNVYAFVSDQFF